MHIDVNSYQLMLGYTYEILHINGATSPQSFDDSFSRIVAPELIAFHIT